MIVALQWQKLHLDINLYNDSADLCVTVVVHFGYINYK